MELDFSELNTEVQEHGWELLNEISENIDERDLMTDALMQGMDIEEILAVGTSIDPQIEKVRSQLITLRDLKEAIEERDFDEVVRLAEEEEQYGNAVKAVLVRLFSIDTLEV